MHRWEGLTKSCPPESWLIRESGWEPKKQKVRETQFALGNGYFCSRGVLEEIPYDSTPGTFIAGLYDRTGAQVTELVNCPNPVNLRIDAYGEKLGVVAMDIVRHERTLDMRHGVLYRQTIFKTTHKKRILYQSRRFISMDDKHLGVMEIRVTPIDAAMTFNIQTTIDTSVSNKGVLTEGRKIHYAPCEVSVTNNISYLCVKTFETQIFIAYATSLEICKGSRSRIAADRALSVRVHKGETVTFRKFFTIHASRSISPHKLKILSIGAIKRARKSGLKRLYEEHVKAWGRLWENADIDIEGDNAANLALRFNLYHLIIAGNDENDDVSIGARTLSAEGYRGHVFWDAEIFDLPFYIYTFPQIARNQLMYRCHRLDAARANAASKNFKGALFPWESADTGEECTPSWAKDLDGTIIRITTLYYEHHIVADIAYAVNHYVKATGDIQFLLKYGLEVIIETARFWHSRVVLNKKRNRYEISHATGPDEFHDDVNNNAFTNMLAQWNLWAAYEWYRKVQKMYPRQLSLLAHKIKISEREIRGWQRVASKIHVPVKKGLIEQFDGYFKLRDPRITELDEHFMPCLPQSVSWRNIGETQLIKQADVVMLLYLLRDRFSYDEMKRHYYYYEKRTLHKSSLSAIIHSIVGLEVGDNDKALHYFAHALSTDLSDIHGNTAEGIHAASAGGAWQAVVMGFAGMRIYKDYIAFTPHLPPTWKGLKFAVWYRGTKLRVSVTHSKTDITVEKERRNGKLFACVNGVRRQLVVHKTVSFNTPIRHSGKSLRKKGGSRCW